LAILPANAHRPRTAKKLKRLTILVDKLRTGMNENHHAKAKIAASNSGTNSINEFSNKAE
jgi:hypothetical protein